MCLPFYFRALRYTRTLPPPPRHCTALPLVINEDHLSVTCPDFSFLMWTGLIPTNEPASKWLHCLHFVQRYGNQPASSKKLDLAWGECGNWAKGTLLVLCKFGVIFGMILNSWRKHASKKHAGLILITVYFFQHLNRLLIQREWVYLLFFLFFFFSLAFKINKAL